MLGAHPEPVCLAAYNYGRHLGLAFQLIDDALDFRASSGTLGKVWGSMIPVQSLVTYAHHGPCVHVS
jgi:geranylgeranyl pyrophosphate synthase